MGSQTAMGDETAINGQSLNIQVMLQHDLYGMLYSSDSVCSFFNSLFIFLQHIFCFFFVIRMAYFLLVRKLQCSLHILFFVVYASSPNILFL